MDTLDNRLQKRMHVSLYALLFLTVLLGLSVLLEGCTDTCEVKHQFTYYEPVYQTLDEIRAGVDLTEPAPIETVGKIYFKDGYLFVNEPGKGIHIIDNRDPSHPVSKNFLTVPGNFDLAIKGNILYADSFIDLVAIDISNLENPREVNRIENIFSNYSSLGFNIDSERGLITNWVAKNEVQIEKSDCDTKMQNWGGVDYVYHEGGIAVLNDASFRASLAIAPGNGSGPGVGGSMARFTINNDYLFTLDAGNVQPIDITSETNPIAKGKTYLGWDIETLFPYGNHLFVGSSSGMHILDVSNPASLSKVSTYQHVRSCDPVVVSGDYAYVTLRSGTECQGFTNQLEVIDISNLASPSLVKTYAMHNPHGLGIDNSTLFVCDGNEGLKVFDASDINTIDQNQLAHYGNINAYDVIPFNNVLMMIGADGIFQYDYTNPKDIKLLSHIAVLNEN